MIHKHSVFDHITFPQRKLLSRGFFSLFSSLFFWLFLLWSPSQVALLQADTQFVGNQMASNWCIEPNPVLPCIALKIHPQTFGVLHFYQSDKSKTIKKTGQWHLNQDFFGIWKTMSAAVARPKTVGTIRHILLQWKWKGPHISPIGFQSCGKAQLKKHTTYIWTLNSQKKEHTASTIGGDHNMQILWIRWGFRMIRHGKSPCY